MFAWTSTSVSLGVVSHLFDSRPSTRTHHPGDVSACRPMRLGRPRQQVLLSSDQGSDFYPPVYLRLDTKGLAGDMHVGLNRLFSWLRHIDFFSPGTQPQLLVHCQVSDRSQLMCGGPGVDMLLSSPTTSHHAQQSPSSLLKSA